jgi:SAM-dependent methyltransferase
VSHDNVRTKGWTQELYNRHRFGEFCYGRQRDQYNRPLLEFLRLVPAESTVFDIGCGAGYWLETAVRLGVAPGRLIAVDFAQGNLTPLKAKGFKAVCGDVMSLPFESHVADVTVCNGVIHHTPAPEDAFRELLRITRPGGLIFLGVYNRWNPYFYVVHRAMAPVRYAYWNWSRRVLDVLYSVARFLFQPLARLFTGSLLDERSGKTMLADQVMNPYAHLFSKRTVRRYAAMYGCSVLSFGHSGGRMMLTAVLKAGDAPLLERGRDSSGGVLCV